MADGVKWGFQGGGAPTPDPERVATIRYTIVDEPQTCAAFAEAAHGTLADLVARAHEQTRAGDLTACSGDLSRTRDQIVALDPSRLEPRRGLAGLFDSRKKRLQAFRAAYASAASTAGETAARLTDQGSAFSSKHDTLETLWTQIHDAITDLDAYLAAGRSWLAGQAAAVAVPREPPETPAPPPLAVDDHDGPAPDALGDIEPIAIQPHPLETRLHLLGDLRAQAVRQLAIIRAVQNTDHRAPATLRSAGQALETWRNDWQQTLGLSGKKPKKVRPDVAGLKAAQASLADHLTATSGAVQSIQDRRVELQVGSTVAGRTSA